jgi:serpin B
VTADAALLARARSGDAAAGATLFAADLLAALGREKQGNLVASPLSVYDVLALLAPGARGDSAESLRNALHSSLTEEALLLDMAALRRDANGALRVAAAAWLQQGYAVREEYTALLTDAASPPRLVDFAADPAAARRAINGWVANNTAGRIPELLPPDAITALTRLVLAGAIALDAPWATPFRDGSTSEAPFHAPGADRSVEMMHTTTRFDHAEGPGYAAVRLPYDGGRLDALVVLPDPGADPLDLLPSVTAPGARDAFTRQMVDLRLPRFELSSSVDLATAMQALGLGLLFDAHRADLSGITGPRGDLVVDRAVHQALLSVDEKGTSGAAATAVTVALVSAVVAPRIVPFTVDRPFLFVVEDSARGVPVFVARVTDPG